MKPDPGVIWSFWELALRPLCMWLAAPPSLPQTSLGQGRSPRAGSAHSLYCSGVQYGASPREEKRQWYRMEIKGVL